MSYWTRRAKAVGYWDYGLTNPNHGGLNVVEVDEHGAGVLACANEPGNQLRHIGRCPLAGPCSLKQETR